jgi:transposase
MDSLVELFVAVDDFWQAVRPIWHQHLLTSGERQRIRSTQLSESEIMTILILFHQSQYRHFKAFYLDYVGRHLRAEFPDLVSYQRFVTLTPRVGVLLYVFLTINLGHCTGISFVDSTPLAVCHNRRIARHRVFDGFAQRGKTSMGWFYGFKVHLVVNDLGEIIAFDLTPGNVDDRTPLPKLTRRVFGKLFGDKGYLAQPLRDELRAVGVDLITSIRRNMKPQLLPLYDKLLLKRRSICEMFFNWSLMVSMIERRFSNSLS